MRLLLLTDDKPMGEWIVTQAKAQNIVVVWVERAEDVAAISLGFQPIWVIWDADVTSRFYSAPDFDSRRLLLIKTDLDQDFLMLAISVGVGGICPRRQMSLTILNSQIRMWTALGKASVGAQFFPRHGLFVDVERQAVSRGAHRLRLTITELRILRELVAAPDETVETRHLIERISLDDPAAPRVLYVHVCSLRKKLKGLDLQIDSIRGLGYRLKSCPTPRPVLDSGDATSGQI